jgi:hypothetical protein
MQFSQGLINTHIADSFCAASLEGQVEVALGTILVPARQWLLIGVVDNIWQIAVCLLAQFLIMGADSAIEEAL